MRVPLWLLSCALVALSAAAPLPALAGALCRVSDSTELTFDPIADDSGPHDGRASFVVTCARTQTTMLSLLYSHRMSGGGRDGDLAYDLFATPDRSSVWGSGGDGGTITETFVAGRPTTIYIYARIPAHQHPSGGRFNDYIAVVTMP